MSARTCALAAIALAGCLHEASVHCEHGGVCPAGKKCVQAGDAEICVAPTCGDGRVESGEACDDGNHVSGDGCPADCGSPCGDGLVDPGEICDDSNAVAGDGCSADCRSTEVCGNGIRDPGEACDDGDRRGHDGCSNRCTIEQAGWTATGALPEAGRAAMAYDAARGTTVLFTAPGHTWEWDGAAWRRRMPVTIPPLSSGTIAMVYDAARRRAVLFGDFGPRHTSAWEWDGNDWIERVAAVTPPRISDYAIAYDSARHKVVLFGGVDQIYNVSTWEWDGSWREVATRGPGPHYLHAMAYDSKRGVVVLYGGTRVESGPQHETWEYDGDAWTLRVVGGPPRTNELRMVFDAARGTIVAFGGFRDRDEPLLDPDLGTTWQWDGVRWTDSGGAEPPPRSSAAAAYDLVRRQVLLFGGVTASAAGDRAMNDFWAWDGGGWTRPGAPVAARDDAGLAYDPAARAVLLFGGDTDAGPANDAWLWDGVRWLPHPADQASVPSARARFAIATDRDGVTIFGGAGADGFGFDDTWRLRGTQWSLESAFTPDFRSRTAMVYDAPFDRILLFGGATGFPRSPLGDTWSLGGIGWRRLFPAHAPAPRWRHAMAFDVARQRVVVFGGSTDTAKLDDLWEWANGDWVDRTPPVRPSPRDNHAMAYDVARSKLVLFGGAGGSRLDDTWEWDGSWQRRTPATVPPARELHSMAYDPERRRVVMFGGLGAGASGRDERLDDVWEWDGTDWERKDVGAPAARSHHAMVYEAQTATVLLFGGKDGRGRRLNDTWIWDSAAWRRASSPVSPSPRADHAMAHDAARKTTLLFGGNAGSDLGDLGDTWEWDGTVWRARSPGSGPAARRGHAMIHDAARGRTLLLGGRAGAALLSDHWAWDGSGWTQVAPGTLPPARGDSALAYDAARETVVLFGGQGTSGLLADVWEWDGARWVDRTPAAGAAPGARAGHTLVYDALLRRVVLFGGQATTSLYDAWAWDGTRWIELQATEVPAPRQHHAMVCDAARGNLVLFGGDDRNAAALGDLWKFRYRDPQVPDEACHTGFDGNGNDRIGCADPDCDGLCASCGNHQCDVFESCRLCPEDCGVCRMCGDLLCDAGETCANCPGDCGRCM